LSSTSIYVLIRHQSALAIMGYLLPSFGSTAWFVPCRPQGMFPKCLIYTRIGDGIEIVISLIELIFNI